MAAPASSAVVRAHLVDALAADLVGPFDADPTSSKVLPRSPSRFYLTGFLAPSGDRDPGDPTDDEDFTAGIDADDEEQSETAPEPKVRKLLPASIGLSVLLPRGAADDALVTLHYAEYLPATADETPEGRVRTSTGSALHASDAACIDCALVFAYVVAGIEVPAYRTVEAEERAQARCEDEVIVRSFALNALWAAKERAARDSALKSDLGAKGGGTGANRGLGAAREHWRLDRGSSRHEEDQWAIRIRFRGC